MAEQVDRFQGVLQRYFQELVLASAYTVLGERSAIEQGQAATVSLTLAPEVTTEPMHLQELRQHHGSVRQGVAELFQTKSVAAWHDLLNDLFKRFLDVHLSGLRQVPQLKKRQVQVDFASEVDIASQLREGAIASFAFEKYQYRIAVIASLFQPADDVSESLKVIRKHVLVRNTMQHRGNLVDEDLVKQLGSGGHLEVLDNHGQSLQLSVGDRIVLELPEMDRLKSALFLVSARWRSHLADLPA